MSNEGDSFFRWLGRQVGHVKAAVSPERSPNEPDEVVYQHERVEEHPHPADEDLTLRRTVRDEAIRRRERKTPPSAE